MLLDTIEIGKLLTFARECGTHLPEIKRVAEYLVHYGYLDPAVLTSGADIVKAIGSLKKAIVVFREQAGLKTAENVDPTLIEKMSQPRCGFSDAQRVTALEAKWRKKTLTYFIQQYVNGLARADQEAIIRQAWNAWQAVADISLSQVASPTGADIIISTGRGAGQGFDGPSGTLAYAYLPTGNDSQLLMRFDLDETWVIGNPQGGILMLNVATHEFGHLLGLDHSRISTALMAPFYAVNITKPQQNDDIPRIQALYGPAVSTPTSPPPTTPPPGGSTTRTLTVEIVDNTTAKILSFK